MKLKKPERRGTVIIPLENLQETERSQRVSYVQTHPSLEFGCVDRMADPHVFSLLDADYIQKSAAGLLCEVSDLKVCVQVDSYDDEVDLSVYLAYVGPEPEANYAKRVKIYEEKLAAQVVKPPVDKAAAKQKKLLNEIAKTEAQLAKLKSSL